MSHWTSRFKEGSRAELLVTYRTLGKQEPILAWTPVTVETAIDGFLYCHDNTGRRLGSSDESSWRSRAGEDEAEVLRAEIEAVKAQQAEALRAMSRSNRRHIARRLEGAKDILNSAISHYARSYEPETFEGQRDVRRLQCGSEIAHVITLLAEAGAMLTTQSLKLAPYGDDH
jgi:hypothetical protein